MYGNLKGWLIALLIFAATGALLFYAGSVEGRSKPTGRLAAALKPANLKIDPKSILPPGTSDKDPGAILRDVADKAGASESIIAAYGKAKTAKAQRAAAEAIEPLIQPLVEAAACAKLSGLFKPDECVVYGDKPYLAHLKELTDATLQVAMNFSNADAGPPDPAKTKKYIEAVFQIGRMLYEDRMIFKEWRDGIAMMEVSSFDLGYLAKKAKDEALQGKVAEFQDELTTTGKTQREIFMTLIALSSPTYPVQEAGDIFQIAEKSTEPMWRVEAILKLGRMRLSAGVRYGDQIAATDALDVMGTQPSLPATVKLAIDKARKLDSAGNQDVDLEP